MGKVTTLFEDESKTVELFPRTKTTAVTDSDGNALGDLAVYNATTIGSGGIDGVKIAMDMDLLWENSSPTSSFSAQTVNINLSEYSMVYVTGSWTATDTKTWFGLLVKVGNSGIFNAVGTTKIYRGFNVSTSGITFENGQYAATGGTSLTVNNSYVVPRQIYGIR